MKYFIQGYNVWGKMTHQNLGWTIDMNLSIATDTVAQIEPLREICRIGRSQGNKNGWTNVWKYSISMIQWQFTQKV